MMFPLDNHLVTTALYSTPSLYPSLSFSSFPKKFPRRWLGKVQGKIILTVQRDKAHVSSSCSGIIFIVWGFGEDPPNNTRGGLHFSVRVCRSLQMHFDNPIGPKVLCPYCSSKDYQQLPLPAIFFVCIDACLMFQKALYFGEDGSSWKGGGREGLMLQIMLLILEADPRLHSCTPHEGLFVRPGA